MKRELRLAIVALAFVAAFIQTISANELTSGNKALPTKPILTRVSARSLFEIDLHWRDKSTNEDGFQIERSTDKINFRQIAQVLPNTRVYRDKNLFPGTRYFYRIRAFNSAGTSGYSTESTRTPAPPVPMTVVVWNIGPAFATNAPDCVRLVKGDSHTLELHTDGTVTAWGDNSLGQASPPTNLTGVVAIAAGVQHSLALKNDGTVVGWGETNAATPPAGLSDVVAIAAGGFHSLALKGDGTVVGWGSITSAPPEIETNLTGVVAIAAGFAHSVAVKSDGTVVSWGAPIAAPIVPTNATDVVAIAAGFRYTLAAKADGTVIGWGEDSFGNSPPPADLTDVAEVAAGDLDSVALKKDGTVAEWGLLNHFADTYRAPDLSGGAVAVTARQYESTALSLSPASPSEMKAVVVAANKINLSWRDNSIGEKGFDIQRAPAALPLEWHRIAVVGANKTNYTDKTLSPDTTYLYRVRAYNAFGTSPFYQHLAVNISAGAPGTLSATLTNNHRVNLVWSYGVFENGDYELDGADGFKIERALDSNGAPGAWAEIALVASTNPPVYAFADSTVAPNTIYWYRIRAFNSFSVSPPNEPVSVAVVPPFSPSLQASVLKNEVSLLFSPPGGPPIREGFKLERAPDAGGIPGGWVEITNLPPDTTLYIDGGFLGNTTNWYRLRSYNWVGDSPYSDPLQAVILPTPTPGTLTASIGLTQNVHLTWFGDEADSFELERAPDAGGSPGVWSRIALLAGTDLSFNDTNVVANTTYWYRLRAHSVVGFSAYTEALQFTTAPPPLAPGNLTVLMADRVRLYWTYSTLPMSGFSIERAPDTNGVPGVWAEIGSLISTNSNPNYPLSDYLFIDTNVTGNATYWYRVRAFNWAGFSDPTPATAIGLFPPAQPFEFGLYALRHTVQLVSVTPVGAFGWIEIERAPDANGSPGVWTVIATNTENQSVFEDPGLLANATYWYRIRAANWVGYSSYTDPKSITIVPPSIPTVLTSHLGAATNSVDLSWSDFGDEDGFKIERAPDNNGGPGAWTEIAEIVPSNVYSGTFTDINVTAFTTNWYRVRAFNDIGNSDYSTPVSIAILPPATPANLSGSSYPPNQISLFWTFDSLAQAYQIERAPDLSGAPGAWSAIANIDGNNIYYFDGPVTAGVTYWYRIRASNWAGTSTYADPINIAITFPPGPDPIPQLSVVAQP